MTPVCLRFRMRVWWIGAAPLKLFSSVRGTMGPFGVKVGEKLTRVVKMDEHLILQIRSLQ